MSLASRAGVSPMMQRRTLAVMGDGGFWHNGLLTGVQSALFNGDDAVLVILKNGYTSATGTQDIISTPGRREAQRPTSASARAREPGHREHAARAGREVAAHGRQLRRRRDARDARRGVHDRLRRD